MLADSGQMNARQSVQATFSATTTTTTSTTTTTTPRTRPTTYTDLEAATSPTWDGGWIVVCPWQAAGAPCRWMLTSTCRGRATRVICECERS